MKHYLITNRPVVNNDGKLQLIEHESNFIANRLYFGDIDLTVLNNPTYSLITEEATEEIEIDFPCDETKLTPTANFFFRVYHDMRNEHPDNLHKRDILLFIHGFGHDVKKSFRFLAELNKKYVENPKCSVAKIIMFMWPSKNHIMSYKHEHDDAVYSGIVLARFYYKLKEFLDKYATAYESKTPIFSSGYLHLVVQSMGNAVLSSMIQKIASDPNQKIDNIFKEILLVGPDVESNVFEAGQPLERLIEFGSRVHIYYHKEDLALFASRLRNLISFKFYSKKPLGKRGPNNMNIDPNIKVVDLSDLDDFKEVDSVNDFIDDNFIQHRYFMYSSKVVKDITSVLNGEHSEAIKGRDELIPSRLYRIK